MGQTIDMHANGANPRVLIILVNWNGKQDTLACLESLAGVRYPAFETVVIDNGSADDSVAMIRAAFPAVRLVETGQNLGFVGGNNLGLGLARELDMDYALLLNNDTEVGPDFLGCLVRAAEADPQVGIAGPSIYYYDRPDTFWSAGGAIDWRRGVTAMQGIDQAERGQFGAQPRPVDFVTGCALLIKMSVVNQIGMLDPRFFAYYEETEWCVRARRAGYACLHVPQARIWHKISPQAREASPGVQYYMTRNRLLFLKITGAGPLAWALTAGEYARTLLSWSLRPRWRSRRPQRAAMLQAIRDFAANRFGKMPTGAPS